MDRFARISLIAITIGCAVSSCAGAQGEMSEALPDLATRQANAIVLREIGRSGEDAPFRQISGIDIDSRGRIFVADWDAAALTLLHPDGRLAGTWGRKGLGPGEFRSLRGVQVVAGDSVLAYDPSAGRLTVFGPEGVPAYVVNLFEANPFLVWRLPGGGGYLAMTRPGFRSGDTEPRLDELWLLDLEGRKVGAPLHVYPSRSFLHVQQGGGFSVMPNPFGHEGFAAVGPRGIYLAWSDTLGAAVFDPGGSPVRRFSHPFASPRVTAADVESFLADRPAQIVEMFGRALADSAPRQWPPLRGMIVDDEGAIWLALPSSVGTPREWAKFDDAGRYLGSVFLPHDIDPKNVRGGRFYSATSEGTIVIHEIAPRR
jgi:hypothetical protein